MYTAKISFFSNKIAKVPVFGKKPLTKWATQYFYGEMPNYPEANGVAYLTGEKSSVDGKMLIALDFDRNDEGETITKFFELLPKEVATQLHRHNTPSGGLHVLAFIPNNSTELRCSVLARTSKSEDTPKGKPIIELKASGGIINVPPSVGYNVVNGFEDIGVLSEEDAEVLINAAKACNAYKEAAKSEIPREIYSSISDYWLSNPIDDYNARADIDQLIVSEGWKFLYQVGDVRHYQHPAKKARGTSATLHCTSRIFYVFSTNTNLPEGKGISPFGLFSHLKFGGDFKRAFSAIKNEYGEKNTQPKRLPAKNTTPMPNENNASPNITPLVFWREKNGNPCKIDHPDFIAALGEMGFCRTGETLRRKNGNVLERCEKVEVMNALEANYQDTDGVVTLAYTAMHTYWSSTFFVKLQDIKDAEIVSDNRKEAFCFFKNTVLKVTKDAVKSMPYSDTVFEGKYFLGEKIINFEYKPTPSGFISKGEDFINKAIVGESSAKSSYVKDVLGFLCHAHKTADSSYIVVATEQSLSSDNGGGAGKDLTFKLLSLLRNSMQLSVSQFKDGRITDDLYQPLKGGESIVNLTDLPERHDIAQYKSIASEDVVVNVKYKNRVIIPAEQAPKLYMSTNYSVQCTDGGLQRRVKYLEFTGFFNKNKTVNEHFGGIFPTKTSHFYDGSTCWSDNDVSGWYYFLAKCMQGWLLKLNENKPLQDFALSETGVLKQLRNYSESGYLIAEYLYETKLQDFLKNGFASNAEITSIIDEFVNLEGLKHKPTMVKLNECIKKYFAFKGVFVDNLVKKIDGKTQRGKSFTQKMQAQAVMPPPPAVMPPPPPAAGMPAGMPTGIPDEMNRNTMFVDMFLKIIVEMASESPTIITGRWLEAKAKEGYPSSCHLFNFDDFAKFCVSQKAMTNILCSEIVGEIKDGGTLSILKI